MKSVSESYCIIWKIQERCFLFIMYRLTAPCNLFVSSIRRSSCPAPDFEIAAYKIASEMCGSKMEQLNRNRENPTSKRLRIRSLIIYERILWLRTILNFFKKTEVPLHIYVISIIPKMTYRLSKNY